MQQIQTASLNPPSGVTTNKLTSITNRNGNIVETLTHSYDASGNLTSDGLHIYKYDSEGI